MFPFPSPNESMNRALEGTEQQELENEILDSQGTEDDLLERDTDGVENKRASDETLQGDDK